MENFFHHLKKELKAYSFDYTLMFTSGIFLLLALYLLRGQPLLEFVLILLFTSFYIIWGMYHHVTKGTVHIKTVVEYILIGFIVLFLVKLILIP
jgi:hypothetical protein